MLYYTEFGLSHMEIPGEATLCIYISGCPNKCVNCHYVELQQPDCEECGPLTSEKTNQRLWKRISDNEFEDITCRFWNTEGRRCK